MKTTTQIFALILLFIAAVVMFCSGCNVIKSKTSFKNNIDSGSIKRSDSSNLTKKDSIHAEHKEEQTIKQTSNGLVIEFVPDSSNQKNNKPIQIITSDDGDTTEIIPGDRQIKSITHKKSQTTSTKNTSGTFLGINTSTKSDRTTYDSSYKRQKILEITKNKKTSSAGFWLVFSIILIIVILIIYCYCQYKKITISSLIKYVSNGLQKNQV